MSAYLIVDLEVTDRDSFERYKREVAANLASFGARYLSRAGATKVLEGDWSPRRLVLIEFPSMARLEEWYGSPSYAPLLELRKRCASSRVVATEGV